VRSLQDYAADRAARLLPTLAAGIADAAGVTG